MSETPKKHKLIIRLLKAKELNSKSIGSVPILIPLIVFIVLSGFETFSLYLNNGYFFLGDMGISLNLPAYVQYILQPWNFQTSSPNGAISFPILALTILSGMSHVSVISAITEKLQLTLFFFLSGFLFYYSAAKIYGIVTNARPEKSIVILAVISGLIYMFNPFSLSQMVLIPIMPYYSLFPFLLFLIFSVTLTESDITKFFLLFITFLIIASSGQYGLVDASILVLVTLVFLNIPQWSKKRVGFWIAFKRLAIIIIPLFLVFIWLYILGTITVTSPFLSASYSSTYSLVRLGVTGYGYNNTILKTLSLNFTQGYFNSFSDYTLYSGFLIFLTSFAGIFVREKYLPINIRYLKKIYLFILAIFSISLLFLIRSYPFVYISLFVSRTIFRSGILWEFYRNPMNYAVITVMSESILIFISLSLLFLSIHNHSQKTPSSNKKKVNNKFRFVKDRRILAIIAFSVTVILASSSISVMAVSFNIQGFHNQVKSTVIPQQYYEASNFLERNSKGETIIFPPTADTHPTFTWSNGISFPGAWPTDAFGTSTVLGFNSLQSSSFVYYTYFNQLNGLIKNDTSYFNPLGVTNIVMQKSQFPQGYFKGNSSNRVESVLSKQDQISLTYNNSLISIYQTTSNVRSTYLSNPIALFGGLNDYSLLSDSGLNTSEFAPIFMSELDRSGMNAVLKNSNIVIFGPNQNTTTAFLEYETNHQLVLANGLSQSQNGWYKTSGINRMFQSLMASTGKFVVSDGFYFGDGESVYSNTNGSEFFLKLGNTRAPEIYLEGITSPFSGNVTINIGSSITKTVDLYNPYNVSLKWYFIGKLNSTNDLLKVINDNGTNILNSISQISESEFQSLFESFSNEINTKLLLHLSYDLISNTGYVWSSSEVSSNYINVRALNSEYSEIFNNSLNKSSSIGLYLGADNYTNDTTCGVWVSLTNTTNGIPSGSPIFKEFISARNLSSALSLITIHLYNLSLAPKNTYSIVLKPTSHDTDVNNHYVYFKTAPDDKLAPNISNGTLMMYNGTTWVKTNINMDYSVFAVAPTSNPIAANLINVTFENISTTGEIKNKINASYLNSIFELNYTLGNSDLRITAGSDKLIVIYDQAFNSAWQLNGKYPVPAYFMINGYFVNNTINIIPVNVVYILSSVFYFANYYILFLSLMLGASAIFVYFLKRRKSKLI